MSHLSTDLKHSALQLIRVEISGHFFGKPFALLPLPLINGRHLINNIFPFLFTRVDPRKCISFTPAAQPSL